MSVQTIDIDQLRIDGGTQQRPLDEEAVAEYAQRLADGSKPPPIEAVFDGKDYWPWDGFHRYHAYRKAGVKRVLVNVRKGTQRDAVWLSFSANKDHGVRRPKGSVKGMIEKIFADPEWKNVPQPKIAAHVGASRDYVSQIHSELKKAWASMGQSLNKAKEHLADSPQDAPKPSDNSERTEVTVTRGGKTYTMATGKIGKKPKAEKAAARRVTAEEAQAPAPEEEAFTPNPDDLPADDDGQAFADEPAAAAAKGGKTPSVPKDATGMPIEQEKVREAFDDTPAFVELKRLFGEFERGIKSLTNRPGGAYLDAQDIAIRLRDVRTLLDDHRPHAVCRKCGGLGCLGCRHTGFYTKYVWDHLVAKEFKS